MSEKVLYWNVASGLLKKWDVIKEIITKHEPIIVFIAEADLKNNQNYECLNVSGYDLIFTDTLLERGKSRMIALVQKNTFKVVKVPNNELNELIFLSDGKRTIVGGYRPFKCYEGETAQSNFERMMGCLKSLNRKDHNIIIGDFNIDVSRLGSQFRTPFVEWMDSKGLENIDIGVTRVRLVESQLQRSSIDLVITNVQGVNIDTSFEDVSDHCLIVVSLMKDRNKKCEKRMLEIMDWRKFDGMVFNNKVEQNLMRGPSIYDIERPTEVDYHIRASIIEAFEKTVPIRVITLRPFDIFSPKVAKLNNRKKKLRKRWAKNPTIENWKEFIKASRMLRSESRKIKRAQLIGKLSKGSKEFWKEINNLMGKQISSVSYISNGTTSSHNKKEIADMFIEFFVSKVEKNIVNYEPKCWDLMNVDETPFICFSLEEVKKALIRLSNKKSSGLDGISGFIIKQLSFTLAPYFHYLFNLIGRTKIIPPIWKVAKISPVFKKGVSSDINNYRPVSVLITVAKVFELCILARLEEIGFDKLFGSSQHGFRKNHGTDTAVSTLTNHLSKLSEKKAQVLCYSADLTAAFDLLRKEVLVEILIKKEVPGGMIRLIFEYLSDRWGFVQLANERSCVRSIRVGCVQGSILGPILFNIYTSELNSIVSPWHLISYADDSYVTVEGRDTNELYTNFTDVFTKHNEWLGKLGMISNTTKTEVLILNQPNEVTINVGNETIKTSKFMKVLGMWLDCNLRWGTQVEKSIKKARSLGFAMRYLNRYLNKKEMRKVFMSHFVSRLLYGCPVWGSSLTFNQRAVLNSVYYKQIRLILHDHDYKLNRTSLAKELGVVALNRALTNRLSVFIFSIYTSQQPEVLFSELLASTYHNDRAPKRLVVHKGSSSMSGRLSIVNAAYSVINKLNFDWLELSKLAFKQQLALHLH